MSCERFQTRLVAFAFGADDPEFRAHLDSCAACRAGLEAERALLAAIDRSLAAMVQPEPSGDFAAHVRRRITESAAAPRPWFAGWVPATAATLALVAVTVWTIGYPPHWPQSVQERPFVPLAPAEKPRVAAAPSEAPRPLAAGPRTFGPPRGGHSAAIREPEVLVPRGEMAAVMRLYSASWNGQADGASLMAAAVPTTELLKPLATPPELKIEPLEIAPLVEEGKPKGSLENR